jgi:hypothetical protein
MSERSPRLGGACDAAPGGKVETGFAPKGALE